MKRNHIDQNHDESNSHVKENQPGSNLEISSTGYGLEETNDVSNSKKRNPSGCGGL